LDNGGGLLTFNGAAYNESAFLVAPTPGICPGCNFLPAQSSQFDVGTFEFQPESATTPEPTSILLLSTVFLGLGGTLKRKFFP
jgi:hypothetical protein